MSSTVLKAEMNESDSVSLKKPHYQVALDTPVARGDYADDGRATNLNQGKTYHLSILDTTSNLRSRSQSRYQTHVRILFERGDQESKHYSRLRSWERDISVTSLGYKRSVSPGLEFLPLTQGVPSQLVLKHTSFDSICLTWNSSRITGGSYCVIPLCLNFFSTDFSCREAAEGKALTLFVRIERLPLSDAKGGLVEQSEDYHLIVKLFTESHTGKGFDNNLIQMKGIQNGLKALQQSVKRGATLDSDEQNKAEKKSVSIQSSKGVEPDESSSRSNSIQRMEIHEKIDEQGGIATVQAVSSLLLPVSIFQCTTSYNAVPNDCCVSPRHVNTTEITMRPKRRPTKITSSTEVAKSSPATDLQTTFSRIRLQSSNSASQCKPINGISVIPEEYSGQSMECNSGKARIHPLNAPIDESSSLMPAARGSGATPPLLRHLAQQVMSPSDPCSQDGDQKSIVCFYVRSGSASNVYHRAVYLTERSMDALVAGIGAKYGVGDEAVGQITYFDASQVRSIVDEEAIKILPDGQDIVVCLASPRGCPLPGPTTFHTTWSKPAKTKPILRKPISGSEMQKSQNLSFDANLDEPVNFEHMHGMERLSREDLETFQRGQTLPNSRRDATEQFSVLAESQKTSSNIDLTSTSPDILDTSVRPWIRTATGSISPREFSSTLTSTPDLIEISSASPCSSISHTCADSNKKKRKREPPERKLILRERNGVVAKKSCESRSVKARRSKDIYM